MVYGYRNNPSSISHTASNTPKCIDTYYVSISLWKWYCNNFEATKRFNLIVLSQISLNYNRTLSWGTNCLECGYCLQRIQYMEMFPDKYQMEDKYDLLDNAIRNNNWAQYNMLCKRWRYL